MTMTNEQRLAYAERAVGELDLLWLSIWGTLTTEELTPGDQLAWCKMLLKVCQCRAWWLQKRQEWQPKSDERRDMS